MAEANEGVDGSLNKELPEWNLGDLFPGITSPDVKASLKKAAKIAESINQTPKFLIS